MDNNPYNSILAKEKLYELVNQVKIVLEYVKEGRERDRKLNEQIKELKKLVKELKAKK